MTKPSSLITPRRYDLAVKWRFLKHLIEGNDPDSVRVYVWHVTKRSGSRMAAGVATDKWKRTLDDYIASAGALAASMALRGFHPDGAVPIDPNGELLDGSHRVACALALGIEDIHIRQCQQHVWAPPWGLEWFVESGMDEADLQRLQVDWELLSAA